MKIIVVILLVSMATCLAESDEEKAAADYVKKFFEEYGKRYPLVVEAHWNYSINMNAENQLKYMNMTTENVQNVKEASQVIDKFNWRSFQSEKLKRICKAFAKLGYALLPEQDFKEYQRTMASLKSNYAKVRVCDYKNRTKCDMALTPDIEEKMSKSRDPEELKYYWREFYDKAGAPTRPDFEKYIELNTKAAKLSGFKSGAEMWLDNYGNTSTEQQTKDILKHINPLYLQLHGFVRHRLVGRYGKDVVSVTGPIPMHLLGNMWAQTWSNIGDIVVPFPNKSWINVTNEMLKQNYTPLKMFQMADDFFVSMGMLKVPQKFWDKSILEKPTDGRKLNCQAATVDFFSVDDVRIRQCTQVNQENLLISHHEMGHAQYCLQYQHQPFYFRSGANPAFHEAVGDAISLSVFTPKHLERVKLLQNYVPDEESHINHLFLTALDKIVFLPFAYTMDKYRYALFRGEVEESEWNSAFWEMREKYSGIKPPVDRTEEDFDAPAKYHISADIEYMRYFLSFVLQFKFHKAACIKAGQYDPTDPELSLDNCDIYGSKAAGEAFANMLSLGSSEPWPDVLQAFTGESDINGEAIAAYFEPLRVWLEAENKKSCVYIGWTKSTSAELEITICQFLKLITNIIELIFRYLEIFKSYFTTGFLTR